MLRPPSLALATCLALAGPASAQASNPLEWLFGKTEPAAPSPAPAEAPAGAKPAPAPAAKPEQVKPPKRPAALPAAASAPSQAGQPVVTAATSAVTPAAAPPLNEQQIVTKANAYFNGLSSLVGDFVQTGGDGRRLTGKLYLQRPGKIRFEYDTPATLEVIADGNSVAVRDRKLATQDLYLISQTPLKFLLRDRIDLGRDIRVLSTSNEPEGVRVALEDKSTLGGTSKITLFFDKDIEILQRWRIADPQGFTTIVALSNLDRTRRVDNRLFVINYERMDANPR